MSGELELVAFLRGQLESDAEVIRLASTYGIETFLREGGDEWVTRHSASKSEDRLEVWAQLGALRPHFTGIEIPVLAPGIRAFLEKFDPKRAMREVEAKRLRLAEIERELADDPTNETALWLLRVEALPYSDRPGYREEWRP